VNPYYVQPAAANSVPYDYSQPVVINIDVTSGSGAERADPITTQPVKESPDTYSNFDEALAKFKSGNYREALTSLDASLRELPNDPVVHEVRALTLFALGRYTPAAASLNSLLTSAPGMDWTTMSTLYGNTDDYAQQLRDLQNHCRSNRTDAAAYFVLAYHQLVAGSKDAAIQALEVVVANQPNDVTSKRMLDALKPPTTDTPSTFASDKASQSTDLVGTWESKAGPTKIQLTITEDSKFVWKAVAEGQPIVELQGNLQADADAIVLVNESQGSMAGIVKSQGADKWQLLLDGAPSSTPGLSFVRVGG
jgi:tetratricopeptide (TPR) repeat protein